ncbi:protein of unknown function UPF0102 [Denitrovibrio acetiphilus DSM 12809]|uniref:UPF0102 protein Dacet_2411 n=1 Tax=Denitrovibrio acetiphilus (strain DSM 12809 / NBRC 114555 / N2460) TaxID=522772 RepID=D4H3S1_DENA2|nr:YraN family protein [Denitrovibrio acetiphilus]ADD69173.1 protein of unknown function UPF0102 [Denitrovibrio acetiphilus DSM 12809]
MRLLFGKKGEKKAACFLEKQGYAIVEMNYRCKFGEIDIIAEKNGVLIFVEVKTRSTDKFGLGYESVTLSKQQKLFKTAQHYMVENGEMPAQFDVISIDGDTLTHIPNAFSG